MYGEKRLTKVQLFKEIKKKDAEIKVLHKLAYEDALTGLGNRRYFDKSFEREIANAERQRLELSVIVVDVNGLKKTNDKKGHEFGDKLIKNTALSIKSTLRKVDLAFRYGGDEFVLLVSTGEKDGLDILIQRLEKNMKLRGVSASVGGANMNEVKDPNKSKKLFELADKRMYIKKMKSKMRRTD